MRTLMVLLLAAVSSVSQAQLTSGSASRLCQAASQESAYGALVDEMIESGEVALTAGAELLSVSCADGQTVLSHMVNGMHAENLEYAVIDMGLSLSGTTVNLDGQPLSLGEAMARLGERGSVDTREFVNAYLDDLADEDFNPNLRLSLK
ncbi:MAG: hypothetical protein CL537_13150 [Alcanivoracaceae bacterium]|uniref:hypothetical protein n=1 Tax=Alcanivorax sp. MD8A TaxID=1177157 RepID=UPI000C53A356|nr:hypothetical protein [Alcanivorax sp. MD8A]MAX56433.1 hypothetical protein [Alcanivoracaceae bacterium]MCG8439466.1 hypothetical protein [Pseudomonadales bacterium]MEE2869648.1 hypothetical protein [Pseudomonadota bacterium]PNE01265.1 hypothetical protein A15D_03160 [Alcanivorax sp. MD8A]|tara:strand:+ start:1454 stop:1900 length:447 start_codon:yes stop_codon:yes gene_type:complete